MWMISQTLSSYCILSMSNINLYLLASVDIQNLFEYQKLPKLIIFFHVCSPQFPIFYTPQILAFYHLTFQKKTLSITNKPTWHHWACFIVCNVLWSVWCSRDEFLPGRQCCAWCVLDPQQALLRSVWADEADAAQDPASSSQTSHCARHGCYLCHWHRPTLETVLQVAGETGTVE